jgi:hypothetical protein
MKNNDIPLVEAIPISQGDALVGVFPGVYPGNVFCVDLPVGLTSVGFQLQGNPPQFSVIDPLSPLRNQIAVGQYVHGISLPQTEIINLSDPAHLMQLIQANAQNPRRLLVSSTPFYLDASLGSSAATKGTLYKHELPPTTSLGIALRGFPPFVSVVAPSSPLVGRLHPGQAVVALVVPGRPIMNMEAGGFRADRVEQQLLDSCTMPNRLLVVKDRDTTIVNREKGSSRAMDDCVIS